MTAWSVSPSFRVPLSAVGWACASAVAVVASLELSPTAGVAALAVAALAAYAALGDRPALCVAVVIALLPAVTVPSFAALAWIGAGALVAVAVTFDRHRGVWRMDDLRRHLSSARRRGDEVDVVVFTLPGARAEHDGLLGSLRLTDSLAVRTRRDACEVRVVVDRSRLDRAGFEHRVASEVGTMPAFGWATFPRDGVTLEALLEVARGLQAADAQEDAAAVESGRARASGPAARGVRHVPGTDLPGSR